jgi:peroxiredoxin
MTIQAGDTFPSVTLKRLGAGGMEDLDIAAYIKGRRVVIFAVPGAFTPTCNNQLPGYVEQADAIRGGGVDEILCVAVNDPFVMQHWGEVNKTAGKVTMIPDGNAALTKALGMDFDGGGHGLGTRSKRYVMVVANGKVESIDVEASPGNLDVTAAGACVSKIKNAA